MKRLAYIYPKAIQGYDKKGGKDKTQKEKYASNRLKIGL